MVHAQLHNGVGFYEYRWPSSNCCCCSSKVCFFCLCVCTFLDVVGIRFCVCLQSYCHKWDPRHASQLPLVRWSLFVCLPSICGKSLQIAVQAFATHESWASWRCWCCWLAWHGCCDLPLQELPVGRPAATVTMGVCSLISWDGGSLCT